MTVGELREVLKQMNEKYDDYQVIINEAELKPVTSGGIDIDYEFNGFKERVVKSIRTDDKAKTFKLL